MLEKDKQHSQAQALLNGKWQYLEMYSNSDVGVGVKEAFEPNRYYDVNTFLSRYIRVKNAKEPESSAISKIHAFYKRPDKKSLAMND